MKPIAFILLYIIAGIIDLKIVWAVWVPSSMILAFMWAQDYYWEKEQKKINTSKEIDRLLMPDEMEDMPRIINLDEHERKISNFS